MALPRRQRKFRVGRAAVFLALTAAVVTLGGVLPGRAVTERVSNGFYTGLAISGYDPVAYFTDTAPVAGKAEFELQYERVVWRFRSSGNRAAFESHPAVYQPRYGGYDPVGVGRGVALVGNPLVWAISGERLYLFYNEQSRAAFVTSPQSVISAADGRWEEVRQALPD
jgi:hypothetical protein